MGIKCKCSTARWLVMGLALLVLAATLALPTPAQAQGVHGIGWSKGCVSPRAIGDAYTCTYQASNSFATDSGNGVVGDDLTFNSVTDIVHAVPDVPSGEILPLLTVQSLLGGAECHDTGDFVTIGGVGLVGSGTAPIDHCHLPAGGVSIVTFAPFSFYTVVAGDPDPLSDTATVTFQDSNSSGSNNPPIGDQTDEAASSAQLTCPACDDENECTTDTCDEATNECVFTPTPSIPCGGGALDTECAAAGCNDVGQCDPLHTPVQASTPCADTDGNECTTAGCDGLGACNQLHTPLSSIPCNDAADTECGNPGCNNGVCVANHFPEPSSTPCADTDENVCTTAGCDGLGACNQRHVLPDSTPCADTGNECAEAGCDGAGTCDQLHTPVQASTPCADTDENVCTTAGCDGLGACNQRHVLPDSTPCADTGNECAEAGCDGAGTCDQNHTPVQASTPCADTDGNECTTAGCDGLGTCDQNHTPVADSTPCTDTDGLECTTAGCDGLGTCDQRHVEDCVTEICRTPGFWGTHARTSDKGSGAQNITQAVIDLAGELNICGECINATVPVDNAASAVEALCVSPKGDQVLQLARQLTAAALNCVISGGGADCDGTSIETLFSECNTLCEEDNGSSLSECIFRLDCFNNGGQVLENTGLFCQTGTCANGDACNEETPCVDGSACTPLTGNCHDQPLCNEDIGLCFEPPGPAGSSNDCNAAIKNSCTVVGPGEAECGSDSCP